LLEKVDHFLAKGLLGIALLYFYIGSSDLKPVEDIFENMLKNMGSCIYGIKPDFPSYLSDFFNIFLACSGLDQFSSSYSLTLSFSFPSSSLSSSFSSSSSSFSSSSSHDLRSLYAVLFLNILDLFTHDFNHFSDLVEKLCLLVENISPLPENDSLVIIHHSLLLTSSVSSIAKGKLWIYVFSLIRALLECLSRKIQKLNEPKKIFVVVLFLFSVIEKIEYLYNCDKIGFKKNEKGLLHILVIIMCNLLTRIDTIIFNSKKVLKIINRIYELLKTCYGDDFSSDEVSNIFNGIFISMDEYMKMKDEIIPESILNMMYELSYLGLKE
jgi:hypothetical protein